MRKIVTGNRQRKWFVGRTLVLKDWTMPPTAYAGLRFCDPPLKMNPQNGEGRPLADGRVPCLLTNLSTAPVPFARNPTRVRGTKLGRLLISRRESYRHLVVPVQ